MAALDWLQSLLGGGQYGDPSIPAMSPQPLPDDALTKLRDTLGQGAAASLYAGGGDVQPGLNLLGHAVVAPALAGGAALEATMTGQPVSAAEMLQAAMMGVTPTPTRLPGGVPGATPTTMERLWADEHGGIRAFHGSPHDIKPEPGFPLGRFREDRIGTGEGAQAYGHGVPYLAEAEPVAESYLGPGASWKYGRQNAQTIYDRLNNSAYERGLDNAGWERLNAQRGFWERVVLGQAPRGAIDDILANPETYGGATLDYVKSLDPSKFKRTGGHMYEVDVHADPESFLHWDKPLVEQSQSIKDALTRLGGGFNAYGLDDISLNLYPGQTPIGRHAYSQIARASTPNYEQAQIAASQALREEGVPGIRYLDQGSRGGAGDTHNLVMFDPSLVEIRRKYGLLPPLAGGGLLATEGPGDDQ